MERFAAVTAATGALGPLLVKLTGLLGDEQYRLQEGTRRDIMSIRSALEPVHNLLPKLWWREDLDAACKDWMTEARELSYDLEDAIDHFILGLQRRDGGFIQWETVDSPFEEFKERVKGVTELCREMETIGNAVGSRSKMTTDPRALFLHKDASELVGMEEKKKELIKLLEEHEMVCIVGFAGTGKTTLADLVYQEIGQEFHCRAFVSVHPSPDMTEILDTLRNQVTNGATSSQSVTEVATEENIMHDISISLHGKRYLVIIDDIWHWEEWKAIRTALPKSNLRCKIIITTRIKAIAEKCQNEHGAHVYTQCVGFSDAKELSKMRRDKWLVDKNEASVKMLSNNIANMCGTRRRRSYCLLAVVCLWSAWAESRAQGDYGEWETWKSHVLDGFLSIPALKPLVQSLRLCFDDLPLELRTCLLYCSIHPPLRALIERDLLVRKWIAEGFVSQEEAAQAYFDELVSRNLLELEQEGHNGGYELHPVMLAFLVCKAKEDNFVACCVRYDGPHSSSHAKQRICRRLSLFPMHSYPDVDVSSHSRSLLVFGRQDQLVGVPFNKLKNLRVLEIKSYEGIGNCHLVDICGLIWLRYLCLYSCGQITELPREIGRLQYLGVLDVRKSGISELPVEIKKLQRLTVLDVSGTLLAELPKEIGELQHLETLNISNTKVTKLPSETTGLQGLVNLDVSRTGVAELPMEIGKLQHLRILNISHTKVMELPMELTGLCRLESLDVSYTGLAELPKEMGKLERLSTLDIRMTKVRELSCREVPNSFLSVVGHSWGSAQVELLPLAVISTTGDEAKCKEHLLSNHVLFNHFGDKCEVLQVPMHRVAGRHMKLPEWVKQDPMSNVSALDIRLCKLGEDDLEFLKKMPNLQALELRFEVLPREPIAITGGGFKKLETFYVDCRLPLGVITFKPGAMPKLKHLEFKFYTGRASQAYSSMGITHLPCLEMVVFRCSRYYTSDSPGTSVTIDVVRQEAAEHPKPITIWVNDMNPEVFGEGYIWQSLAEKAIIEQQIQNEDRIAQEEEQKSDRTREEHFQRSKRLLWAAERRAKLFGLRNQFNID